MKLETTELFLFPAFNKTTLPTPKLPYQYQALSTILSLLKKEKKRKEERKKITVTGMGALYPIVVSLIALKILSNPRPVIFQ